MTVVTETYDQLQNNVQLLPEVGLWHFERRLLQPLTNYGLTYNIFDIIHFILTWMN